VKGSSRGVALTLPMLKVMRHAEGRVRELHVDLE
jgi:hypothetical protein